MNLPSFRTGLLAKLIGALALIGLLPTALVSYRLIDLNRTALGDQVLSAHALAARSAATALSSHIAAGQTLAEAAANNPTIYLDQQSRQAQQLLADLLYAGGEQLLAVSSFDKDQNVILRAQRKGRGDLAVSLLPQVEPGKTVLVNQAGHTWLLISKKFPETGDLRLLLDAAPLQNYLNPVELGDQATMLLAMEGDETAFSSKAGATIPPTMRAHSSNPHVSGSGRFQTEDGRLVLGAHAPLDQLPWRVISWQPAHVAESISYTMQRRALEALGLALLLGLLLSVFAWRGVILPIRRLLSKSGLKGGKGDEIAQLQAAFSALERHVEDAQELEEVFLGRYKVLEKVGEGGMGMVFHGWDPKLKRPVALKTIHLDLTRAKQESVELIADLVNEATAAANINHSNVVNVYDATDVDDMAFVAMEFVDGPSVAGYIKKHGPVSAEEALSLLQQISLGLQAAHDKGIVHRDIKPANILLGRDHSVKIADFGISQFMNAVSSDEQIYGTPGYLPPETLHGAPFNSQGDLFALGATIYFVLTGHPAFPGSNVSQIIANTIKDEPHLPPELNAPPLLHQIVMRLLNKNPEQRYQSTAEVLADLAQVGYIPSWHFQSSDFTEITETDNDILDGQYLQTIDLHSL